MRNTNERIMMNRNKNNISENTGKVSDALAKIQMEMGTFTVNKKGFNFSYLNLAGILEKILPIMGKHNLSMMQFPSVDVVDEQPWVKVVTRLSCEDEWIETELTFPLIEPTKKTDSDMSMLGSSISYMRRYAVQSIFGIAGADKEVEDMQTETIEDGNKNTEMKLK